MNIAIVLFFISLLFGTVIRIPIFSSSYLYVHDVTLLLVILISAWNQRRGKRIIPRLAWSAVGFAGIGLFSLLVNIHAYTGVQIGEGMLYTVRWLMYAAIYWVVVADFRPHVWAQLLYVFGVGLAATGIIQLTLYPNLRNLWYLGWDPHYQRVFSTLLDPNFSGVLLAMTFFWGIPLFYKSVHKLSIIIGQVIVVIALILTYSRSSWISFAAGCIIWILFVPKVRKMVLFTIFACIISLAVLPKSGEGRNIFRMTSSLSRIENWKQGYDMFRESPVFGKGFNMVRWVERNEPLQPGDYPQSHAQSGFDSSFLFILATTGVTGGLVYILLLLRLYSMASHVIQSKKNRLYGIAYTSALTALFLNSWFINSLFYPWIMLWLWIAAGIIERFTFGSGYGAQ